MSILVGRETRLVVQGITGRVARTHLPLMRAQGASIVGGVAPGRGGERVDGIPVFDTVLEALRFSEANTSLVMLPPAAAADGILEALDAQVPLVVCVSEGIPAHDMLTVLEQQRLGGSRLIGPNCPGLVSPGEALVGFMPSMLVRPGFVGVASRSGTLSYEACWDLMVAGLGQSSWVGVGGDALKGTSFTDLLPLFADDPQTRVVALLGEIGGSDEERAAELLAKGYPKPVVALIAGESAPRDRTMGHAGAIISGSRGTHASKVAALREAGAHIATTPKELASLCAMLGEA